MAMNSSFTALPDDVLQRVLLGVALDDHLATASACRAFRAVIRGPRFPTLRRQYGFAERGIILVGQRTNYVRAPKEIFVVGKRGAVTSVPEGMHFELDGLTTDGGARLFFTTRPRDGPNLILAVDAAARRWSRFATLPPHQVLHCIEWHDGLLYACGGSSSAGNTHSYLNTFRAFDETTGLWEDLPPMPHACANAASGVIGNELFIAGGRGVNHEHQSTLQIYDFTTRTWRLGAPLPQGRVQFGGYGVVVDGKLYLVSSKLSNVTIQSTLVYDVQSNTWTELRSQLPAPPTGRWDHGSMHAFAHEGRIVAIDSSGDAVYRGTGTDPSADVFWPPNWRQFDLDMSLDIYDAVGGSVLLG